MNIKEIKSLYPFHDAKLNQIVLKENNLEIVIHFCEWQIEYLKENNKYIKGIKLTFEKIKNFKTEIQLESVKNLPILEFKSQKNQLEFILDIANLYPVIKFNSSNISCEEIPL